MSATFQRLERNIYQYRGLFRVQVTRRSLQRNLVKDCASLDQARQARAEFELVPARKAGGKVKFPNGRPTGAQYAARRRERLHAAGLCVQCGQTPTKNGKTWCRACLAFKAAKYHANKQRAAVPQHCN